MSEEPVVIGMLMPDSRSKFKYGFLRAIIERRAAIWERAGQTVIPLQRDDPNFFRNLVRLQDEPRSVLFLNFSFDLAVSHRESRPYDIAEMIGRPTFAVIDDHPFADFMVHDLLRMSATTRLFGQEPGYMSAISDLRADLAPMTILREQPPSDENPFSGDMNAGGRDIDLLVPVDLRCNVYTIEAMTQECIRRKLPPTLAKTLYERFMDDYERYPWDVFTEVLQELTGQPFAAFAATPQNKAYLSGFFSTIDMRVRAERRLNQLADWLKVSNGQRTVVLNAKPDHVPDVPGVDYIGHQNSDDYFRLLLRSRAVMFCHPTYPNMLNCRVPNALTSGAAVVADPNPFMQAHFGPETGVFVIGPDGSVRDCVDAALAAGESAARKGAQRFAELTSAGGMEIEMIRHFQASL